MEADRDYAKALDGLGSGDNFNSPDEQKYSTAKFARALADYENIYIEMYPEGKRSEDRFISLRFAVEWRATFCPGHHQWHATTLELWRGYVLNPTPSVTEAPKVSTQYTCERLASELSARTETAATDWEPKFRIRSYESLEIGDFETKLNIGPFKSLTRAELNNFFGYSLPFPDSTRVLDCFGTAKYRTEGNWFVHIYVDRNKHRNHVLRMSPLARVRDR